MTRIIADLIAYFCRSDDSAKVDFRRATPLLAGLHNLFTRRLAMLVRDTESTLKEMSDPLVKLEQ